MRILATSDLHMQMSTFDYVKDKPAAGGSLAKLANIIGELRVQAATDNIACLLFDNGDTLQGTPVADMLASATAGYTHPMIDCLNALDYDAIGLGNHDFDHGLQYLSTALAQLKNPVVCSNFSASCLPMVLPHLLLTRSVIASDGTAADIRIGVISSLPEKTALWSRHHLDSQATIKPPLPILAKTADALRAQGADVVVALAHMGLALFDEGPDAQNQISDVAALSNVDAIIGGHTHLKFPGPDHADVAEVCMTKGTVRGKPMVQPGSSGSDLGVIEIELVEEGRGTGWTVAKGTARLVEATPQTSEDARILERASNAHETTRTHLAETVASLAAQMNSFFALATPSPIPALLATAKQHVIEKLVADTPHANLPIVAAASAPLTGGFDGPDNFLMLAAGDLQRRHIAGMNPYANQIWAVKTNGARIADWLERAAVIFNTLQPNQPDQMLIDPRVPGFRFDAIYGLTYVIDPRKPPRFDASGRAIPGNEGRVSDICWQGEPVEENQEFIVATTDHRASGGGLYRTFRRSEIVVQGHAPLKEAVLDYLQAPNCAAVRCAKPWWFPPNIDRTAILLSAPEASEHLADIADFKPEPCGLSHDGFLRIRLHF